MEPVQSERVPMEFGADPLDGDLYARDFYSWVQRQADLMKAGRLQDLDVQNLIEEVETLGRSEAAALESAYRLICLHQLKRIVQPERAASRSWTNTIVRERLHAARVLRDNPGLKSRRAELFAGAYADARKEAAAETKLPLDTFPLAAPFTLEQATDESFWAEPQSSKLSVAGSVIASEAKQPRGRKDNP